MSRAASREPGNDRRHEVIPEPHEYLSFLMGVDAIADDDLTNLGVKILERHGSAARGLLVPASSLSPYSALVRERLSPGFWNEIVGRQGILFIFKLTDGTIREFALSEATSSEISQLCSSLNDDPIEKTSDLPRYLSGNLFYKDLIAALYTSEPR
jgi:hypothetical protein